MSTRGRKRNDALPPSRARDVQRAFRARRAAHLHALEERIAVLEQENSVLRRAVSQSPSARNVVDKGHREEEKPQSFFEPDFVPPHSANSLSRAGVMTTYPHVSDVSQSLSFMPSVPYTRDPHEVQSCAFQQRNNMLIIGSGSSREAEGLSPLPKCSPPGISPHQALSLGRRDLDEFLVPDPLRSRFISYSQSSSASSMGGLPYSISLGPVRYPPENATRRL